MTNYLPPDPSVGEFVHRKNEVLRECLEQIEHLNDQELRDLVNDSKQSSDLRVIALLQLVPRRDRDSRAELLCDFLDDPDPDVSAAALSHCPLIDKSSIEKARRMVGSPHGRVKCEAVVAWLQWTTSRSGYAPSGNLDAKLVMPRSTPGIHQDEHCTTCDIQRDLFVGQCAEAASIEDAASRRRASAQVQVEVLPVRSAQRDR